MTEPSPTRRDPPSGARPTRRDQPAADPSPSTVDTGGLPEPVFARYLPIKHLGVGGEAQRVLLVRDRATGAEQVVKVYGSGIKPDPAPLAALRDAKSRHLVEVVEWGDHVDSYGAPTSWEVLEYVAGGSLRELIKSEGPRLDPRRVRAVLVELADALTYLHTSVGYGDAAGLAHRDIKPENVLVRRHDPLRLALCDFGLVAEIRLTRRSSHRAGTAEYQAPETWRRKSREPAQDWWSLGVLLVELLTGRNPNAGAGGAPLDEDALIEHLTARGVDLSGVTDPRWHLLCQGLLAFAPEHRWTGEHVEAWLHNETPTVHSGRAQSAPAPAAKPVPPFEVAGRTCRSPAEVALAMQADFDAGCQLFQVRHQRLDLNDWLTEHFAGHDLPPSLFRTDPGNGHEAAARVTRFIAGTAPSSRPSFRGWPVDAAGLGLLAQATAADPTAAAVVAEVDGGLLRTFARHDCAAHPECRASGHGCLVLEAAADQLGPLQTRLDVRARTLPTVPGQPLYDLHLAGAALLRMLVDPAHLAAARGQLDRQKLAASCPWWADLRREAALDPAAVVLAEATRPVAEHAAIAGQAERERQRAQERTERVTTRSAKRARVQALAGLVGRDLLAWSLAMCLVFCVTELAAGIATLVELNPRIPTPRVYAGRVTELQTQAFLPAAILLGCVLLRPARPWAAAPWVRWIAYLLALWIGLGVSAGQRGVTDYPVVLRSGVYDLLGTLNAKLTPPTTALTNVPGSLVACGVVGLFLSWFVARQVTRTQRGNASTAGTVIRRVLIGAVLGLFLLRAGQVFGDWQIYQLPGVGAWLTL